MSNQAFSIYLELLGLTSRINMPFFCILTAKQFPTQSFDWVYFRDDANQSHAPFRNHSSNSLSSFHVLENFDSVDNFKDFLNIIHDDFHKTGPINSKKLSTRKHSCPWISGAWKIVSRRNICFIECLFRILFFEMIILHT